MKRILSLLPASTEILFSLGAGEQVVGITHECDFPRHQTRHLPVVTSARLDASMDGLTIDGEVRKLLRDGEPLYELDYPLIERLAPEVIAVQGICLVCAISRSQVDHACTRLRTSPQIIEMTPHRLDDVLMDIQRLGDASDCVLQSRACVDQLRDRIMKVVMRGAMQVKSPRVLILEWLNPFFSAGHWNPELIELAGGQSAFGVAGERSIEVTSEQIRQADPDIIVISCCGFSVQRIQDELRRCDAINWGDLRAVRSQQLYLADGRRYFNRPGPRLVDSLEMLSELMFGRVNIEHHVKPAKMWRPWDRYLN